MKLGLLGKNIGHSLSPKLHRIFGELCGIDIQYDLIDVARLHLKTGKEIVKHCVEQGYSGINVTIPLKIEMLDHLDIKSNEVENIQAVNTIAFTKDGLKGYNSDYLALSFLIERKLKGFETGGTFLIKGAGGFARAAAHALASNNNVELFIVNRNFDRAFRLEHELKDFGIRAFALDQREIYRDNLNFNGLMNATPIGMGESLELPFDLNLIKRADWIIESIYSPSKTMFLNIAESQGDSIISGLEILFYQGLSSFEIWTGKKIDAQKAWDLFLK